MESDMKIDKHLQKINIFTDFQTKKKLLSFYYLFFTETELGSKSLAMKRR